MGSSLEYRKQHYFNNKLEYKDRAKRRVSLLRKILVELKLNPCMDCGIQYPSYVMHFDHRPGIKKVRNISELNQFSSVVKFLEEVDKCDLVCANCHAERTFGGSREPWWYPK